MTLSRLLQLPFAALRQARWKSRSWSKASDRRYHDGLYEAQDYDPFRWDYPGYVTIRRFADHAEALLPKTGTVLDVGCGPGEITCELARRHPDVFFRGIDHSEQAIRRANRNVERLKLPNARFDVSDAERLPEGRSFALVTMFDAFHHLERPRDFLAWLDAHTTRCVLIEPAGTRTGRWPGDFDIDWLLFDLANIRHRLESACGEGPEAPDSPSPEGCCSCARGEGAVERRYALDDFERFFRGWHVRVTGTVAGFDRYPPGPHARTALSAVSGEVAYTLTRAVDEILLQQSRDGAAKHWVIAATKDDHLLEPRLPPAVSMARAAPAAAVASPFDVWYERFEGPARVKAGSEFRGMLEFVNRGWDEWRSDAEDPVRVSYHWLDRAGATMLEFDGRRTDLPVPVAPGRSCRTWVAVRAPSTPGHYVLAIDLVKERVRWFSEAGMPWFSVRVEVTRR